jgi:NSS family neurotransmitter:Na+ symporter
MLVLAASGAAIGFNNFWQFPFIVDQYGGGAFLIVYLFCVVLIGVPLLMAEFMLGHRGHASPIGTFQRLAERARCDPNWVIVGWLAVIGGFVIFSYLSVIAGWTLASTLRAALGMFEGQTADGIGSIFATLVRDPEKQLFWYTVFVLATLGVAGRGLEHGLEAVLRYAVPLLFGLLLLLLFYAATTEAFGRALAHLFVPDFARLSTNGILTAMGHAFFSLGLGVGVMLMFGAYAGPGISPLRVSLWVAAADTLVGLVAAVIVFSVLYSGGVALANGPALVFQSLPLALDHLPFGRVFSVVLFVLLAVVAWVLALALIEPVLAWLTERFGWRRGHAALVTGAAVWVLGLVMMLSIHPWAFSFRFYDSVKKLGLFDMAQILTSQVLLPLCGFCVAVFVGWGLKPAVTREALDLSSPCLFDAWLWLVRIVIPLALVLVAFNLAELFA